MCHLKKHIAMVHEIHDKTVPCPRCPKILKNKESLKNHISGVHEGKYKSVCHLCDKELATPTFTSTQSMKDTKSLFVQLAVSLLPNPKV